MNTIRMIFLVAGGALAVSATRPASAQSSEMRVVSCVSDDGQQHHCEAFTGAGVALQRSIGLETCLLGRNWGYDATGVWVTEGCGAEFVVGNPQAEQQRVAAQPDVATPGATNSAAAAKSDDLHAGGRAAALGDYTFYTRFGAQLAFTNDEAQLQDASSRVGFLYSTGDRIRFIAAAELSMNLTRNASQFNPGETTSSGFVVLDRVEGNVFGTRLGYVGLDFGSRGRLTFGKQWGVHYDIASYTDTFNVFGAEASATFNADTDGGLMGTGRADSALTYRNTLFGLLDVGAQVQLREFNNGEKIDGFGLSVQIAPLPGLRAGVAYTRAFFDDSLRGTLLGLDGDGEYGIVGVRYEREALTLAAVYARQTNGDIARFPEFDRGTAIVVPEVFDADGYELYGRYQTGRFGLLAGWLDYMPDTGRPGTLLDPRTERRYGIAGFDYALTPGSIFFAEYRLADGYDQFGVPGEDVFVVGLKYRFRKAGGFYIE